MTLTEIASKVKRPEGPWECENDETLQDNIAAVIKTELPTTKLKLDFILENGLEARQDEQGEWSIEDLARAITFLAIYDHLIPLMSYERAEGFERAERLIN